MVRQHHPATHQDLRRDPDLPHFDITAPEDSRVCSPGFFTRVDGFGPPRGSVVAHLAVIAVGLCSCLRMLLSSIHGPQSAHCHASCLLFYFPKKNTFTYFTLTYLCLCLCLCLCQLAFLSMMRTPTKSQTCNKKAPHTLHPQDSASAIQVARIHVLSRPLSMSHGPSTVRCLWLQH